MSGAGQYEILGVLGSGGFGTVYRARFRGEGGFSKEVALKALNPHLEGVTEIAARLRDEARVLGLLRHRAIVHVDRLVRANGRWIVVMEYVEGADMARVLRAGPIPLAPALEIVAEVAGALNVAWHRPGEDGRPLHLLHRDIKPSNIQLTTFGEVKVLDFGIARAEFDGREGNSRSVAFGSLEYMAPERLDFSGDSPSGDIYSLGAVLHEALTGKPFGRTTADRARHTARLQSAMDQLRADGLDPEVVELIAVSMDAEPEARPTAAAFEQRAHALRLKLSGELLRYWTERTVGPLLAARGAEEPKDKGRDPFLSTIVVVTSGTEASPAEAPPPGRSRAVMIASAALSALLVLGVGAWFLSREEPAPPAPAADATPAAPAPPVTPSPPPVQPAEPAAGGDETVSSPEATETTSGQAGAGGSGTKGTTAASGATTPTPPPPEPPPAEPPPAAPSLASVKVDGDALAVELDGGSGSYKLPASVPSGDYRIWATFAGTGRVGAGKLSLKEGDLVSLRCQSGFNKCVPR